MSDKNNIYKVVSIPPELHDEVRLIAFNERLTHIEVIDKAIKSLKKDLLKNKVKGVKTSEEMGK